MPTRREVGMLRKENDGSLWARWNENEELADEWCEPVHEGEEGLHHNHSRKDFMNPLLVVLLVATSEFT